MSEVRATYYATRAHYNESDSQEDRAIVQSDTHCVKDRAAFDVTIVPHEGDTQLVDLRVACPVCGAGYTTYAVASLFAELHQRRLAEIINVHHRIDAPADLASWEV